MEGITTIGDKDQNTPLSQFSIKGVFTKELDIAQLTEKVDLVVHCVKDLPTTLIEGLGQPGLSAALPNPLCFAALVSVERC